MSSITCPCCGAQFVHAKPAPESHPRFMGIPIEITDGPPVGRTWRLDCNGLGTIGIKRPTAMDLARAIDDIGSLTHLPSARFRIPRAWLAGLESECRGCELTGMPHPKAPQDDYDGA